MGYRSTVAYTIRFIPESYNKEQSDDDIEKCKQAFYLFLAEAKAKPETEGAFQDEDLKVDEQEMAMYFFADDVKWYEGYTDVDCHEALVQLSRDWADDDDGENSNPYIGGAFSRIGEQSDDAVEEVWGQGDWDWIRVSRELICDWLD